MFIKYLTLKSLILIFFTIFSVHTFSATKTKPDVFNNQAFSFIGFAVGELSYKESGTLSSGIKFSTNPKTTNILNQSGGYTPIGRRAGFYINTVSSLYSTTEEEYWQASGSVSNGNTHHTTNGAYQQNLTSSGHNELDVLFSYFLAPGHKVLMGGSFTRTLMDRNNFEDGNDLINFNQAHLTPAIGNADVPNIGAEDLNNDGILDINELVATYGVDPSSSIVNFTETFTDLIAQVGYTYDSRFVSKRLGLRLLGGFLVGVPLYYDVVNTSRPLLEFKDNYNGYNIKTYIGAGWRINQNIGVVAKADYFYRFREKITVPLGFDEELQRERTASIPENELQYLSFNLMAYWNFN